MTNHFRTIVIVLLICLCYGKSFGQSDNFKIDYVIIESVKNELIFKVNEMSNSDRRYRSIIELGTLDEKLLLKDKELSKKGDKKEYLSFVKSIKRTITKNQTDSLMILQNALDMENYTNAVSIINKYGYPSKERIGSRTDKFAAILLHFPSNIKPNVYLEKMTSLLLPEVHEGRMEALSFAKFHDNISTRFLGKPQLYGTVKSFNTETMTPGLPKIEDLLKTNIARKEIGLNELVGGEYLIYK